MLLLNVVL
jgi:hypothetical protein